MNQVNSAQVQKTNDASALSKCSAVNKEYWEDEFIRHFVEDEKKGKKKKTTRSSLIHLGYYTRAIIINKLIASFIEYLKTQNASKYQIVSFGAGFDTTFWRLSQAKVLNEDTKFIEVDFPSVINKKILLVNQSQELSSYLNGSSEKLKCKGVNQLSHNYFLIEADLSEISVLESLLDKIPIDYNVPTLFLSECVMIYMKDERSDLLIWWMAGKFKNGVFVNYEQIHPSDGFGVVMVRHFNKLQSVLYSLDKYPDCDSHLSRYEQLGFENAVAVSEWDALRSLASELEITAALTRELFDEFEEFHNKCAHYVVAVAGNGLSTPWINSLMFLPTIKSGIRKNVKLNFLPCNKQLYRHSSTYDVTSRKLYLFGGCTAQERSARVYEGSVKGTDLNLENVSVSGDFPPGDLDMAQGTVTNFELNGRRFFCVYGGRKSPRVVCNEGAVILFENEAGGLVKRAVITAGNPSPRYRTRIVSFCTKGNEAHVWMFGGRSPDLQVPLDCFWRLELTVSGDGEIIHGWKELAGGGDKPCGRMSHGLAVCSAGEGVYLSGGLKWDLVTVLNDVWKWCCRSACWQKLLPSSGKLLPRYGHTSHVVGRWLYLVGGVNTAAEAQPALARVDLESFAVTEFAFEVLDPHPVLLFNHSSEVVEGETEKMILIVGGGGNCFSFGTYLNRGSYYIRLSDVEKVV